MNENFINYVYEDYGNEFNNDNNGETKNEIIDNNNEGNDNDNENEDDNENENDNETKMNLEMITIKLETNQLEEILKIRNSQNS